MSQTSMLDDICAARNPPITMSPPVMSASSIFGAAKGGCMQVVDQSRHNTHCQREVHVHYSRIISHPPEGGSQPESAATACLHPC